VAMEARVSLVAYSCSVSQNTSGGRGPREFLVTQLFKHRFEDDDGSTVRDNAMGLHWAGSVDFRPNICG
jgi:hypothetical protein